MTADEVDGSAPLSSNAPRRSDPELPADYSIERLAGFARNGRHREAVGGMWDEIGRLVFDHLRAAGLERESNVLDIGCGALRVGVLLVDFLESARYFGLDPTRELIDAGYDIELRSAGLTHKLPRGNLAVSGDFEVDLLPAESFDVAFAISVFTHLPIERLRQCLERLAPVMQPGRCFHATVFVSPPGTAEGQGYRHQPGGIMTFSDRNPFHYEVSAIMEVVDQLPWSVEPPVEWGHPRAQQMVRFTRTSDETRRRR